MEFPITDGDFPQLSLSLPQGNGFIYMVLYMFFLDDHGIILIVIHGFTYWFANVVPSGKHSHCLMGMTQDPDN